MAEFGEDVYMFDKVKQDLLVKKTSEWMTQENKTDLLKLAVESHGIEKLGKELFFSGKYKFV